MAIRDELNNLALASGIEVPQWYLNLLDEFQDDRETEEVYLSLDMAERANKDFQDNGAWGFRWEPHYWAFGGDGAGGLYFFDSNNPNTSVYYIDHEDPPKDINDTEHLGVQTPEEFRSMLIESEITFKNDCDIMRERVKNRRWWQFWVPRKVPKWACQQGGQPDAASRRPLP